MDDTLITNREVDLQSFNTVLEKHQLPPLSAETLLNLRKKGHIADDILKQYSRIPVEQLITERKAVLQNFDVWKNARLNNGVKQALQKMKARNDRVLVLTRKEQAMSERILIHLGVRSLIDGVYTSHEKDKFIADLLHEQPNTTIVFVSDAENDLIPVKKLPVTVYCFKNAYKEKHKMQSIAKMITSLEEVL
jgi:phosphoglycolate phosphatase-like HAD superfamily hydrolase